ncbi:hypothetical protein ACFTAO_10755 [Paenibacillus rhizoplanae]
MKQSGRIRRTKAPYTRLFRDSESLRLFLICHRYVMRLRAAQEFRSSGPPD